MPIHVPASLPAIRFIIIIPEKEPEYTHICGVSPVQTIKDTERAKKNNNSTVKIAFGFIEVEYQVYSNAYIEENHEQTEDSSNLFHHPVSIHTESFS
jgi:hypothetical protein